MSEKIEDKLKGFIRHGFVIRGESGNQAFGDCLFCEKENKFYVNTSKLLWDCKICSQSGNFNSFLSKVAEKNALGITTQQIEILAKDRQLPNIAFQGYNIGREGIKYTLPIKNSKGEVQDLRIYVPGKKIMSTPGCSTGIFNLSNLLKADKKYPVYICEGEWDCIAFNYLLKKNSKTGIAIGIPGANTFKKEWVEFFVDRECIVMYDNDAAGESGEHQVVEKIHGIAKKIRFLHWPDEFAPGYDVRDYVSLEAVKNKRPLRCYNKLIALIKDSPRKEFISPSGTVSLVSSKEAPDRDLSMDWKKFTTIVQTWLRIKNLDQFLVSAAVVLSNEMEGDPLWVFLVACPGEGKSETLNTFKHCEEVFITSSITPNSLISGAINTKGREPSLLPKLDGKTLCIKDFSTIQTMRDTDRDALLGILRDAYDGAAGKVFGTGEEKYFESKFTMLAGVTPSIYELDYQFSSLGERFLKFFIGEYIEHKAQHEKIMRAMSNVGKEDSMKDQLSNAMYNFIENTKEYLKNSKYKAAELTPETESKIAYLSMWCCRIKGIVNRDKYERDVIINKAYTDVGTRTGKQLKRMLLCLPTVIYAGKETEEDFNLIKKIALDTVSAKREDIFRAIYLNCNTKFDAVDTKQITDITRYSYSTIERVLDDLVAIGSIVRTGTKRPFQYRVTDSMRDITVKATLYQDEKTKLRTSRAQLEKE